MTHRDFCNARANKNDARSMLRYVSRREMVRDGRRERVELEPVSGGRESFTKELLKRDSKGREVAYMSVVISPERRDLQLSDDDWRKIAARWSTNRNGKEEKHIAFVHRDSEHEHLHLAVARSYYSKSEYERLKDHTRQMLRELERERDQERSIARIHERELERVREHEQAREQARQQEPARTPPWRGRELDDLDRGR